jgi:hypothetical protein
MEPSAFGKSSSPGAASSAAPRYGTKSAARLRRGRVSVRGEALVNFEKAMRSALAALASAQEMLAQLKIPPDAIPKPASTAPNVLRILSEYARRGEEALSRYGLTTAE